jgi:H+/gluconate symporter-like permease
MLEKAKYIDWATDAPALRNTIHVIGNPQMAMIFAAIAAMLVLTYVQKLSFRDLEHRTESALIDAGLIILIVSAGGAFGEMLRVANVGDAVKDLFQAESGLSGALLLCVAFAITAMIKTAQGSSTAAMITSAAIFSGIIFAEGAEVLPYNVAYLAVAIGLGSCVTGWMNDGGFWLFCKIGGIKETDALKTWTVGLTLMGFFGLLVVLVLSQLLPLTSLP